MKAKLLISLAVVLAAAGAAFLTCTLPSADPWERIQQYQTYVSDEAIWQFDEDVGLSFLNGEQIPRIRGALGGLVDEGEVVMSTFAIPHANSKENVKKWIASELFIDAVGPTQLAGLEMAKPDALIFTAWYKASDEAAVKEFLKSILADTQ